MAEKTFENKKQKILWIGLAVLVAVIGLVIRLLGIEHVTADMEYCLTTWFDQLKAGNGLHALAEYDGDYNMPYVTVLWLLTHLPVRSIISVKTFSIVFDYLCAIVAGRIIWLLSSPVKRIWKSFLAYTIVVLSPVVIMDGAYWGQCDVVYVTFLLLVILCFLKDYYKMAFFFLGCAFSFKLQAVLLLPIICIYYWKNKKFPIWNFLIVPLTMELLCIPAILGGCSPLVAFNVYTRQMGRYPYVYVFYPNIWTFFQEAPYYMFGQIGIIAMLVLLLAFAVAVVKKKGVIDGPQLIMYATWTVMTCMMFLPCMHERYGYLLEILTILVAVLNKKKWWLPVCVCGGITYVYLQVTFCYNLINYVEHKWVALLYLATYTAFSISMLKDWKKENQRNEQLGTENN